MAVKKREKAIHLLENEDDTMNTMNQKRYINLLSNLYNNLLEHIMRFNYAGVSI